MSEKNESPLAPSSVLGDAVKMPMSMRGHALLQWGFGRKVKFPEYSLQMPEVVVDQILAWRDEAKIRGASEKLMEINKTEMNDIRRSQS